MRPCLFDEVLKKVNGIFHPSVNDTEDELQTLPRFIKRYSGDNSIHGNKKIENEHELTDILSKTCINNTSDIVSSVSKHMLYPLHEHN